MLVRAWLWLGLLEAALVTGGFFWVLLRAGWSPGDATGEGTPLHDAYLLATTMTFAGITACQVGTAFAARTTHASLRAIGVFSQPAAALGHRVRARLRRRGDLPAAAAGRCSAPPRSAARELASLLAFPVHRLGRGRAAPLDLTPAVVQRPARCQLDDPLPACRVQPLDGLAQRHAGRPGCARHHPVRDQVGALPGRVAQHPADRLADEELLLAEHRVGVAGEAVEVAVAARSGTSSASRADRRIQKSASVAQRSST